MAFFENLGKKASETTAKVMQKTQEMTEISRINGLISEEEKKLSGAYYQIGKLYVSVHGSDNEPDFAGMVDTVLESEKKILEYKKQIQDIKGIQRCSHCGAEIPKGVAFCSSCGAPVPNAENIVPDDSVRCENCGAMVKRGMRFCTSCGKPMNLSSASATPDVTPSAESTSSEESTSGEKTCPKCGAVIATDASFCTECGTKL